MKTSYPIFLLILVLSGATIVNAQTFVNQAAAGSNDGSSWTNAYLSLHDALENYEEEDEIWVAAGTYLPSESSAWDGTPQTTFYIHQNVKLYGGFSGSEGAIEERDPEANPTILSGDLNGDDALGDFVTNRSDNAMNVMFVETVITNNTIIDGFEIVNGHADGGVFLLENQRGGGIWTLGSPQLRDCRFSQNYATSYGGGLYLRDGASAITSVENCQFVDNLTGIGGGGMCISTAGAPEIVVVSDCQFFDNRSDFIGAGLYVYGSSASVSDCGFENNTALGSGGGLYLSLLLAGECTVMDCNFESNTSSKGGGCSIQGAGSDADLSNITISDCNFVGNVAAVISDDNFNDGGGLYIDYLGSGNANNTVSLEACLFQGNTARVGGGINANYYDGTDNQLHVNNCEYLNNSALDGGAIQIWELGGDNVLVTIQNSIFSGNSGNFFQAIAHRIQTAGIDCRTELVNCLFHNNGASDPVKSTLATESVMDIGSCTFSDNENTAINLRGTGQLSIRNTILSTLSNPNVAVDEPTEATLISNGGNLISDDSMDAWLSVHDQSATAPTYIADTYGLAEGSSGVDEGVIHPNNPTIDLAGNARVQGSCIDIGAYESPFNAGNDCVTGVDENLVQSNNILIYPNPTSDIALVVIDNAWLGEIQVSIINAVGQQINSFQFVKSDGELVLDIDVKGLPQSIYHLVISNGKAAATVAFVKL